MEADKLQSLRVAGIALAVSAMLASVLMHHHPHGGDGAAMIRGVHGGLLALLAVQPVVIALVARALGWNLLTSLAAFLFAIGSLGAMLAGTINGFVVPALWAYPEGEIGPGVGQLAWEMNQALATNGAVATGAGIALIAISLWQAGWRVTSALGVIAGLVPPILLIFGVIDMHFYGAMATYLTQLSWLFLFGMVLAREASRAD